MERQIGETFDYEGHKLEVTENKSCTGCFFEGKGPCDFRKNVIGYCSSTFRSDSKDIIFKDMTNMKQETKEIKIDVPEGMEIDKENSTFECIKFKKKEKTPWRNNKTIRLKNAWIITIDSRILSMPHILLNSDKNHNLFATEKQAKSALAMAQISQIMANDERFGGVVTEEEWKCEDMTKYVIIKMFGDIECTCYQTTYHFLAFHTKEQRDLFLQENEDLVKDYLMVE